MTPPPIHPPRDLRALRAATVRHGLRDIRHTAEYRSGHLPGAVHIELGELGGKPDDTDAVPDGRRW